MKKTRCYQHALIWVWETDQGYYNKKSIQRKRVPEQWTLSPIQYYGDNSHHPYVNQNKMWVVPKDKGMNTAHDKMEMQDNDRNVLTDQQESTDGSKI